MKLGSLSTRTVIQVYNVLNDLYLVILRYAMDIGWGSCFLLRAGGLDMNGPFFGSMMIANHLLK